jgi:AcrR family transcriptional regulator
MPRIVDVEAERAAILEGSFQLFAEQGYGSVRMRQLATSLGMSIGKLYHYFPDKRSIAQALFAHVGGQDIAEGIRRLSEGDSRARKLEQLSLFLEERAPRLSATLMVALDHRRLEAEPDTTRDALRAYQAALIQQIGLDPADQDVLFSLMLGKLVRQVLDPEGVDEQAHRDFMASLGRSGG